KLGVSAPKCYHHLDLLVEHGFVRVASNAKKGNALEYEIRRVENENEENINAKGLLNWSPIYMPIPEKYLVKRDCQIQDVTIPPLE
ncbi:MAG: hypothetical protein ACFFE5_11225, partial [Candidatus Thorarchaeota archaeon]